MSNSMRGSSGIDDSGVAGVRNHPTIPARHTMATAVALKRIVLHIPQSPPSEMGAIALSAVCGGSNRGVAGDKWTISEWCWCCEEVTGAGR